MSEIDKAVEILKRVRVTEFPTARMAWAALTLIEAHRWHATGLSPTQQPNPVPVSDTAST